MKKLIAAVSLPFGHSYLQVHFYLTIPCKNAYTCWHSLRCCRNVCKGESRTYGRGNGFSPKKHLKNWRLLWEKLGQLLGLPCGRSVASTLRAHHVDEVFCADCRWPLKFVKSREMPLECELPAKLRRCWKKLAGHNFNVRAKSFWEKSDFLAEKWISWKWIETPGDKRLDERRRADFRWTLHVLADMRIRIMTTTTTTTTMMLMLCTSGGWAKADFRDEKCENSGRRNYMYLRMQQHQNWMYETCVALSPLVTIPFGSNAAHTMCSNTPLWTVCGYQVPNTTWHAGNKSICLSTYQIKVHGTLALQAHLLCTWAG